MRGHTLKRVHQAKYLGLLLNDKLTLRPHIDAVASKANRTLGFLRRNLQIGSKAVKERAFQALVRPSLEYCCSMWDPSDQSNIHRLEMIQRRAARYVTGRYRKRSSVGAMLSSLGWPSLQERRRQQRLCMFHKIVHGHVAVDPGNHMKPMGRRSRHAHCLGQMVPQCSKAYYRDSFFPRTIRDWNSLPEDVATIEEPLFFKLAVAPAMPPPSP